jgi:metal-responsive CopG/Arc/MetJ family transcriptional regulator
MNIIIDKNLADKLSEILKESSFKSHEELVDFILREFISKHNIPADENPDEKQILRNRLKNLGYL